MTTSTTTPQPALPGPASPYARRVVDGDAQRCSVALSRAFGILGKRWNGVILGALSSGPAGFAELSRAIGGISDSVLSDRLSELAAVGLVSREVAAGPPVTVAYALTPAGRALDPILGDLEGWVREHPPAAAPSGTPTEAAVPGAGAHAR